MTSTKPSKSFIEVQFPIGPLSIESYIERLPYVGKPLNSLGKWWGGKPLVLTRAIILGALFPASEDPDQWPMNLDIFLRCMCLDNAGMWKRKVETLPADICLPHATEEERAVLFDDAGAWKRRGLDRKQRQELEKRVFQELPFAEQREYCCRIDQIDGPPEESWPVINAYLETTATSLPELVEQLSMRRYGGRLKVGDAFSGIGSIPFEAAALGCDVYASDLNPVACLLTWGALNVIGGSDAFRDQVHAERKRLYNAVDAWIVEQDYEASSEGWRAEAYLYCLEIVVPEWDGWSIPISPSWVVAPKTKTWVELAPIDAEKRFAFVVRSGDGGYEQAESGTKQGGDIVCPQPLWDLFKRQGRIERMPRSIGYNQVIESAGGLRLWEKDDVVPRPGDVLQERLFCIRWRTPRLLDLLREEQKLLHEPETSQRREAINALITGILAFLSASDQERLKELRARDWIAEDGRVAALEEEIAQLNKAKSNPTRLTELRRELKECKHNVLEREATAKNLAKQVPGIVYREPQDHDMAVDHRLLNDLKTHLHEWQQQGWIPSWRIEPGEKTFEPIRTRGWTYWHHLFTPRQLLMLGKYSMEMAQLQGNIRAGVTLTLGVLCNYSSRLCHWRARDGGGMGGTNKTFYNQALNTFYNYPVRSWSGLFTTAHNEHKKFDSDGKKDVVLTTAAEADSSCTLWITDPPYADAVNYEELSEFFLAWYVPHLKAAFPDWYVDSMRQRAVKGEDAPFRVAMAECYRNLASHMPDDGMQVLMFTHKSTDVWEDLALIMWAAGLQVKQVWSVATETPGAGVRTGNYVQATYNMVLRKRQGDKMGFVDFITPQVNKRVREVITHMRESQVNADLARCGYTDTDYLLAAQATAAEVVTGYASIDGLDLDAELRTPNAQRGRSALRTLMDNAKRTATDFLVPPAMSHALARAGGGDVYQFWRQFTPEEKFLLKGLESEAQGVCKLGAFMDLGRAYGLANYESLLGPTRANDTRTLLPEELPRPDGQRFVDVLAAERDRWRHSPTRHVYYALRLLQEGAEVERAVKHVVDATDFWNIRATRLAAILGYLCDVTAAIPHWSPYQDFLAQLAIGVEHYRG